MHRFVVAGLCLTLSACQPTLPDPRYLGPPERIDLSKCGGDPVFDLMGHNVAEMPATGGWATLRVIEPGMAITEDYSETRLNVEVDDQDRITGVWCG